MKRKTLFLFFLSAIISAMAETSLIIKPLAGSEHTKALAQIGYVKVTQDSLFVRSHTGNLFSKHAIKDIRHIRYGELGSTPTSEAVRTEPPACRVYPNPAQDMLIIDNAGCETAHVFDLNGHLLWSVRLHGVKANIDVSTLPVGEYLLLINSQTYKFIKR